MYILLNHEEMDTLFGAAIQAIELNHDTLMKGHEECGMEKAEWLREVRSHNELVRVTEKVEQMMSYESLIGQYRIVGIGVNIPQEPMSERWLALTAKAAEMGKTVDDILYWCALTDVEQWSDLMNHELATMYMRGIKQSLDEVIDYIDSLTPYDFEVYMNLMIAHFNADKLNENVQQFAKDFYKDGQ